MTDKIHNLVNIALMAAIICVLSPWSIPIGPVPITLGLAAVLLAVYLLGTLKGTAATCIYLLIGLVGLPVFSGFSGGASKLAGPTGGYLIGYIPMALIAGFFIHRFYKNVILQYLGMALSLAVLYIFGTAWLCLSASMTVSAACAMAVWPFIPFDLIKLAVVIALGRVLRSQLVKAGLLKAAAA